MAEISLATEVQFLKGVGPRAAVGLRKVGLETVGDLLYHLPRRYDDRRNIPRIAQLRPGQWATIRGRVTHVDARPTRGGMVILKAIVNDGSGSVALTWFNQPWIKRQLEEYKGDIVAYGQIKDGMNIVEMAAPEWETIGEDGDAEDFARIVPVYPLTEGLGQKTIRRAIGSALSRVLDEVVDPLPPVLRRSQDLPDLIWALRNIHFPEDEADRIVARRRLVFDEFFFLQIALAMQRAETHQQLGIAFPVTRLLEGTIASVGAPPPTPISSPTTARIEDGAPVSRKQAALERAKAKFREGLQPVTPGLMYPEMPAPATLFESERREERDGEPLWDQIHRMLPFELTNAQQRVIKEIWHDMEQPHPMNRLVQGDVGSGKTAVAACCMLAAVRSGYQSALMAPTEILAEQHAVNLRRLFEPLGIDVALLVGKQTAAEKKRAYAKVASGEAHLAVGTHALIQEGVKFARLGLAIVDEQHRFGVLQRKAIRDKGFGNPDVLVMTATPIPRTLTMTTYGDLDLSVIDELPPGRKAIKTHWKMPQERDSIYLGVRKLVEEGRQAYFVCPMVSESEKMMAQAAEDLHYRLEQGVFASQRVGLLHGQMKPKDKETVMEAFRRHELDILVSTTVIEVGVDVPNASVMVIEDANRFGLSQLHQLRGRVGRGDTQSYCILIADGKGEDARARMEAMVATTDGFRIAEEDLKLRGPGVMAGTQQSGNADFKVADLVQDGRMLEVARQAALKVIEIDPALEDPMWTEVKERVRQRRSDLAVVSVS